MSDSPVPAPSSTPSTAVSDQSDSLAVDPTAISLSTLPEPSDPEPPVTSASAAPSPSAPNPTMTSSPSTSSTSSHPSQPAKAEGSDSGEDNTSDAEIGLGATSDVPGEDEEGDVPISPDVQDVGESHDYWVFPPSNEEADLQDSIPIFPYPDQAVHVDDEENNGPDVGDDDDNPTQNLMIGAASEESPPQWLDDANGDVGMNDDGDCDDATVYKEDCRLLRLSSQVC